MLKGRLGLATARIPHTDRHGLIWLSRGRLFVEHGTLRFVTAGTDELPAGTYDIPYQGMSMILLGPGSTITHDTLRLLSRHGTGLICTGDDGVRHYAAMPYGPDNSEVARAQARLWADPAQRNLIARRMYARRLGEILPHKDITVLRGIEGARARKMYPAIAAQYGITWKRRDFDRQNPDSDDPPNQAINHTSTITKAAAMIATSATGALPQLGFIHEASGQAFSLDIADLWRDKFTLPVAFASVQEWKQRRGSLERTIRRRAGLALKQEKVIPRMIDTIKALLEEPS